MTTPQDRLFWVGQAIYSSDRSGTVERGVCRDAGTNYWRALRSLGRSRGGWHRTYLAEYAARGGRNGRRGDLVACVGGGAARAII